MALFHMHASIWDLDECSVTLWQYFVFACSGMVELVPSSETLRKIQVEYGVTGSFKDKPLAEWLRKYNPAEDEYEKVN